MGLYLGGNNARVLGWAVCCEGRRLWALQTIQQAGSDENIGRPQLVSRQSVNNSDVIGSEIDDIVRYVAVGFVSIFSVTNVEAQSRDQVPRHIQRDESNPVLDKFIVQTRRVHGICICIERD